MTSRNFSMKIVDNHHHECKPVAIAKGKGYTTILTLDNGAVLSVDDADIERKDVIAVGSKGSDYYIYIKEVA